MPVLEPLHDMSPLLLWAPAFGMIAAANALVAALNQPLGKWRWAISGFLSVAPASLPPPHQYNASAWGALNLLATTLTIISAARLPDLDHALRTKPRSRVELFVWMSLPMAQFSLTRSHTRMQKWSKIRRLILRAAAKWIAWCPFWYLITTVDGQSTHWILRSAVLIFYFVLNVTAAADLLMSLTLLLGSDVDELFESPLYSSSPRDFWSRRWNKFINRFALKHVALRIRRQGSPALVVLAVFATSGVFHEYFSWGASPGRPMPGFMMGFFLVQGLVVWLGMKIPISSIPRPFGTLLTFIWMSITAPLFFVALIPALEAFGFPRDWYPFFWRE